jgi:hypothetical protein
MWMRIRIIAVNNNLSGQLNATESFQLGNLEVLRSLQQVLRIE